MKINCIEPKLILHHKAKSLIIRNEEFYLNGRLTNIDETPLDHVSVGAIFQGINHPAYRKQLRKQCSCLSEYVDTLQNAFNRILNDNYVVNRSTGEIYPLFQMVPCGHCQCCRESKYIEWNSRILMESQLYSHPPLFFTLTYDEAFVGDGLLHRDHVQKFIKRFRQVVVRDGLPLQREDLPLRLYGHAEYGKRYQRPHIHFLLWNYPVHPSRYVTLNYVKSVVNACWHYGDFPTTKPLDISYSRDAGKYVSKYLLKPSLCPKEKISPSFFIRPQAPALGRVFFDENFADFHRHNPHIMEFSFVDKFTNSVHKCLLFNYLKNRIFPSVARMVRPELRHEYARVVQSLHDIINASRVRMHRNSLHDFYKEPLQRLANKCRYALARLHIFRVIDIDTLLPPPSDLPYLRNLQCAAVYNSIKGSLSKMLKLPRSYFDDLLHSIDLYNLHQSYRNAQPVNELVSAGSYAQMLSRKSVTQQALEFSRAVF